jgi:competence protein ComEC
VIDDVLERRWPTALVLAACVGLASATRASLPVGVLLPLCCGAATGAVLAPRGVWRLLAVAALLACAGLAWGTLRMSALDVSVLRERVGEAGSARIVVTSAPRRFGGGARVFGELRRFGTESIRERVLLELPNERAPPRGAITEIVRARLYAPRGPETGFDERAWLAGRGVHVVVRAADLAVVGRRGGIGGVADRLRTHVEHSLARGAAGERLALLRGIVLGDDSALSPVLRDEFRASGLAHLTAVSGQNVAIVALGIASLAWLLAIGRLGVQVCAIVAIGAYTLAVGWEPSVARAAVAGAVASLAVLASRRVDGWHALGLGALLLLVWRPSSWLDPGFQLSFVAVAAILVTVPRVRTWSEGYPRVIRPMIWTSVAIACSVATAPIVWLHFGYVALWTVPANVAAEPAMPLVLGLSLGGSLVEPALPGLTATLSWLAGEAAAWIAGCARFFAGLPHAEAHSGTVVAGIVAIVLGAFAVSRLPPYRRRTIMVSAGSIAVVGIAFVVVTAAPHRWSPPTGLRVTFLDVGQGDAALLEVRAGAVLVDEGPPEAHVARQLRRLGVRSLSALVLTHPQRDHIGGAEDVLRALAVDRVLDPKLAAPSDDYRGALAAARDRRVDVSTVRAGDVFSVGQLVLRVLWPKDEGRPDEDPNEHAVVLLAEYGDVDVLLTADAESNVTSQLRLRPVDVLKVAHHGSQDAGLPRLLRALRPRVAVISVGADNRYGHPRAETIDALEAVPGLQLLRTDRDGAVVVETTGREVTVTKGGEAGAGD